MSETIFEATLSLEEMREASKALMQYISARPDKTSWVIEVTGDLGTGKTTLFQTLYDVIHQSHDPSFTKQDYLQSPTFTYLKTYEGDRLSLWHVDAYRMKTGLWFEVFESWQEAMAPKTYLLWVEWYQKVEDKAPDVKIELAYPEENQEKSRLVKITA